MSETIEIIINHLTENRKVLLGASLDWANHIRIRECLQIEEELIAKLLATVTIEAGRKLA